MYTHQPKPSTHLNSLRLLPMTHTDLRNNILNTSARLALCLRHSHGINLLVQTFRTLLRSPGARPVVAEEHFNLLNRLAARLGVREPELQGGEHAEGAEDEEEAVFDVAEGGRDEEPDGEVELCGC